MNNIRNRNVRTIFGGIGIAMLLCVLMLMMSWSAVVQNSDINAIENQSTEDEKVNVDDTSKLDIDDTQTAFNPQDLGFEEDQEMLGMRTETSKTYLTDDGLEMLVGMKPIHFENTAGQLVEIDTTLISTYDGYEVTQSPTKVTFGHDVENGFSMELAEGVDFVSGLNPRITAISEGSVSETNEMFVNPRSEPIFLELEDEFEADSPQIGGSSINYGLSQYTNLQYHTSVDTVKQELRIDMISPEMKDSMDHLQSLTDSPLHLGLTEDIVLPEGTGLFAYGMQIIDTNGRIAISSGMDIVHLETGKLFAQIGTPVSFDSADLEVEDNENYGRTVYFVMVDEAGTGIEITTAVEYDWLIDENTNFPVVIDPSITNTYNTDTTSSASSRAYMTCEVRYVDCFSTVTAYPMGTMYFSSYSGQRYFPLFDFTFPSNTFTVKNINAYLDFTRASSGYGGIVVMEDCGGSEPAANAQTSLNNYANPNGCTGNPLPEYVAPPTGGAITYNFNPSNSGTSDSVTVGVSPACTVDCSTDSGAFDAGGYDIDWKDSYGDGPNGGTLKIYLRAAGATGIGTLYTQYSGNWYGSSQVYTMSVPAGQEMIVAYTCSSFCYESSLTVTPAAVGPNLPPLPTTAAAACSPNCVPTGSETPTSSLTLANGKEAYMEWTTSSGPGADENLIYYRTSGTTGWSTAWDVCTGTGCTSGATYDSYTDGIIFQTPGTYEFLVWDTNGDGTGAGSGGSIVIADLGTTTGTSPISASGARIVSMVSTEQLANFRFWSTDSSPQTINLCSSVTTCNDQTSTVSMISDAVNAGTYIELGMNNPQSANYAGNSDGFGYLYANNFWLVVELEDNTPDSTPPTLANAQYQGNSYVEGARTLYLDVQDSENSIDTTTATGPKMHYSTDGGNTYTQVSATPIGSCFGSNTVCSFSATTGAVNSGTTVDYYWTYSDSAAVDNNKVPPQSPNAGRSPATGDYSFTVLDINSAPTDGTDMKLVTKVDNVRAAYDSFGKSTVGDIDRQMTYYASTGEFLFEFGLENCGANFPYGTSLSIWEQCFSVEGGDFGDWGLQWEGTANDCYPGKAACASSPTNSMDLNSGVTMATGLGNLVFSYDSVAGDWAMSSLTSTGINDELSSAAPNVQTTAHASLVNPNNVETRLVPTFEGSGNSQCPGTVHSSDCYTPWTAFTVGAGEEARFAFNAGSYPTEIGILIRDATTQNILGQWGDIPFNLPSWASSYTSACTSYTCDFAASGILYSDTAYGSTHNSLPNNGIFTPGTYEVQLVEQFGDGIDGGWLDVQIQSAGGSWSFGDANLGTYSYTSSIWESTVFPIDLSATGTPSLGTNDGFGGVSFGTATGEFNMICVASNGLVMFKESTNQECTPDVTSAVTGGQWQGFAMGATKQGEQTGGEGMLWTIRNAQPDPDIQSPVIEHGALGDSHSLDRAMSFTISDIGYAQEGLDSSGVPGQGPTLHYEIVPEGSSPTGVYQVKALTPPTVAGMTNSQVRTDCSTSECVWTAELTSLTRGSSVVYYATAQDVASNGANTQQTATTTFTAANPTNTLVMEWIEYAYSTGTTYSPCSMQVIMYDVTNEFEFHYDDDCYVVSYEIDGLVGHRLDSNNYQQVKNTLGASSSGNPHDANLRFTLTDSGTYSMETFDLGIANTLPLASSTQIIYPDSGTFTVDNDCYDYSFSFNTHSDHCAGLFDMPDDFSFDFWGTTWDGATPNNQIHASASGMLYFTNDPAAALTSHQGSSSLPCWSYSGIMCDLDSTDSYFPTEPMMAPWWSREANDYCYTSGGRACGGVYYRTLPFDGQGKTVTSDITSDETWYLIDSPIKVNPSSADGYLSINADLTIESGVEVIVAEGRGISFDGGAGDANDGTCAQFTADTDSANRITFDVDRSVNPNALWHGIAFTDDCNGAGLEDRHIFDNVDISNTEYAAITAGSRPAPKLDGTAQDAALSCGDAANDCDAGEFIMTAVTFTNVDSAFSHGSGQGTTVDMDNFAVTDARSACFNFAENTIATLTGSAGAPSTMTRCNTNNVWWGGAVVSMPGSTAGSLTMSYVDITDSFVSGIRTDLKTVSIDNVDIVNANNQYPIREINNALYYPGDQEWDSSGVSLELNYAGPGAEIMITDFSAPGYHHGKICSAGKIVLTNVDLGTGLGPAADGSFVNHEDYFDIQAANTNGCGGTGLGTFGADSSFDNFDVGNLYVANTFPTMSNMDIDGVLVFRGLTVAGAPADPISLTNVVASEKLEVDSCGANIEASGLTTSLVKSVCSVPGGKNFVTITSSTITHTDTFLSAIEMEQTRGTMIGVDVQSTTINANGPYIAYAGYDADVYLVEVNLIDGTSVLQNCADNSVGMSTTCHVGKAAVGIGNTVPVLYAGSYASATAYRLGSDTSTTPPTPTQIAQTGVSITASTLDSTGAEIFGHTIGLDTTDSTGVANNVIVITGDDSGTVYDSHHIRASGPAGAGEAHPLLADGTPASEQQFVNGVLQAPPTAFGTYNIGSNVDVRLTAPPVTFDDTGMDCSWMANNATFANADPNGIGTYVFRGATMVLASSMTIDNCNVVLEGSKLIWREDTLNNPTLTVTGTGTLTLALDPDTGDLPKIYGEGNLDAVDLAIGSGGVVDFQAGTMKNLLMDNSKDGLIVLEEGSTLKLAGNAFITGADTSTMGTSQYPLIYMDGGLLEVNSATLAGTGNVGVGVYNSDAGQIKGSGLTVTNMEVGLHAYYGSIELDDYTSTGNTNGIIAEGSPSLPQIYSSAVLQGITTNTPYSASSNGMNHCRSAHFIECYQWETYTVDLSSWVGIDDYIQPSMMLNYGGTYQSVWSGWGSVYPYVSMDNLKITMTDTSGNSWVVDGTSNNGVGYYPYSATDPAVTNGGATYMGGQGGPAAYDCNNFGTSLTPWRFGTGVYWDYAGSPQTLGTVWGNSDNGYGEGFGFRWNQGTIPHAGSSFHSYPRLNWGIDEPYTGRFGVGSSLGAGYKTTSTSPNGVYEVCSSYASPYTVPGLNTLLEWPTVDISDPSIENVELSFDYWHRYSGSGYPWYPSWVAFYNNNNPDNMELLARSGDDPGNFGDYSKEVKGFGTTITNSQITDANIAIDIKGDVLATITNMDIDNPTSFAVRTSGANDIVLDGLDVDDSSAGANTNYGFYTTSTSTGTQEVRNSNFNGLGTAIYVNNDVSTSITNTVVANGDVGIKIGSQSEANHQFTDVTVNNNNMGILAEGIGKITMANVNIQGASATSIDLEITDSNEVEFLDGEISQSLITIDPTSAGKFTRDRSYFAVIEADGATLADTNVIMSSRDAAKSSSGVTDANGVTSGLRFGVYSMDSTGLTDFTQFLNTYSISSVAKVSYSFTDSTTNDGDFRYIQTSPTLLDAPYDSTTNTNYQSYALVDNIDVRVCTNDATSLVVANCAGTLSSSGDRVYTSGMLEFGDTEAIDSTVDLTNKAIMIDSGLFELRDGVTYDMSNSVVFHTGVDTQFGGGGIGQWISDAPYGTTVKMHGGEINGLMQANDAGDAAGLIIGGLQGTSYENPMGLDFDGVSLNNIAGLATSNGDLTTGAWSGLSNYQPTIISIKNSFINHYRGYFYYPSQYFDLDYCVRLQGGTAGDISGNTFSDCTMGVVFMDSAWHSTGSTSQSHSQVGADGIIIKDNTFVGASGWNVYAWPDADADFVEVTNNDMSCALCGHVRFRDSTSVNPTVEGNTFNNGQYGVYTTDTEYVVINDNTFNNQENMAIRANEGDFDVTNNVINNAGTYAIYADSLEKPDEVIETVIAGINSPQPDDGVSYVSCGYSTVTCPDVQATLSAGEEMIMKVTCGAYCGELRVDWKDPATGLWNTWDPTSGYSYSGDQLYSNVDGTAQYILGGAGTWFFNLWDTYGDGINGGQLEIIKANAGAWSAGVNQNPIAIYDPGCCGGGGLNTYQSFSGGSDGHSNTDTAQYVLQNTGATDITYEFRMNDNYGDGANGNSFEMYTAQVGTWNSASNGPTGVYAGGINDGRYGSPSFTTGSQSDAVVIILPANQEMKFVFDCVSWCGESYLQWQEIFVASTLWGGPEISGNDINFDTTNNDPLAVALYLGNCDMADYSINTESNTIDIGQNAVENEGCVWNDKDSVITGADVANSIGYNDDNAYAAVLELDGTTISGFGTGVYKTTSGTVLLTGGASITAGTGGIGVHTKDIDVSVIDATVDGGLTGTGIMVEDSSYAWFYPMDVSGNVGIHAINSEILWDVGTTDADTAIRTDNVQGTIQSITESSTGGIQIDAQTDSSLTVIDFPLDETRMLVDSSSIVDEANWLNIDATHLGGEPANDVGLIMTSTEDYAAYNSPIFSQAMLTDGDSADWFGGNTLNPSGYAMPGAIGGGMLLTTSNNELVVGFDQASTATSDVYIYVDSAHAAGSDTGFNNVHTLPSAADYVIKVTSTSTDVYSYSGTAWVLDPSANAQSSEGTVLEVSAPLSSIGASGADSIGIVGVVQDIGTDTMTAVSPAQTITSTGPESLTDNYDLELSKLDLTSGDMVDEVVLHRSFEGSSTPSPLTGHTYDLMVKTAAEVEHSCDYDWATETGVVMDSTKSLTFDILRACPVITNLLGDIVVDEDTGDVTFDLATYVDDEQDVEANMAWDVTESNLVAHDNVLTNWNDLQASTGTATIKPLTDQFGTFDLTFEVVDSHGQTVSKTITYTVNNINDAPVICDARADVDPNCDTGDIHIYSDTGASLFNVRNEGFGSYSKLLGDIANDTANSFIRDMANEQSPVAQKYDWTATSDCDQMTTVADVNVDGNTELAIVENTNWEYGGVCLITLDLIDDGAENTAATSVDVEFSVAPVNDAPEICDETNDPNAINCLVESTDASNAFNADGANYRLTLVEDTTDSDALTFDLANIKSDIDHLMPDLTWVLSDTNSCNSGNYYKTTIVGDTLTFELIADATTNAQPWEVDMLNNNGIHQTRTATGYCDMTLTLSDTPNAPSYMPNYTLVPSSNYVQESVSVVLSVKVDNVVENVPDYFLDATEGFDFNGVNNIMPGTYVPVDFSINAGGDEGPYTYDHLLIVELHTDGHTESELPRFYTPPAYGQTLDIDDWEVYMTDETTEVWVEIDVVTCEPGAVCTPAFNMIQNDNPESHNGVSSATVFGKWSEPGRIGESSDGSQSNRRPAFEDKNWCNNLMSSNAGTGVAWSDATSCGHSDQGYNGPFAEDWQTGDNKLPVTVSTIGALSVASFAPSMIAVALTGLFVSALVFAGRREDDEEEIMEQKMSDDESAVSPVIATILMVAITVVLSGVVYVWAAQLADTDTKGVPRVTFTAENVDTANTDTDHWKITVGQAQTVLATQAVEVTVTYVNSTGDTESQKINLASTQHVYGFSPYNSDSLVTFGDVVTIDGEEVISTFSTGDDIYVKTHLSDGTPLVDARIVITYNPPGDAQGSVLKTYSGLSWNQPI